MSDFAVCSKCDAPLWQALANRGFATHLDDVRDRAHEPEIKWVDRDERARTTIRNRRAWWGTPSVAEQERLQEQHRLDEMHAKAQEFGGRS